MGLDSNSDEMRGDRFTRLYVRGANWLLVGLLAVIGYFARDTLTGVRGSTQNIERTISELSIKAASYDTLTTQVTEMRADVKGIQATMADIRVALASLQGGGEIERLRAEMYQTFAQCGCVVSAQPPKAGNR